MCSELPHASPSCTGSAKRISIRWAGDSGSRGPEYRKKINFFLFKELKDLKVQAGRHKKSLCFFCRNPFLGESSSVFF